MAYAPEYDLNAELALLVDKARRAGALAQHLKAQGLIISYKSDGSIVTNADLEVNLWLKEALLEARPDYGWQSEESPDTTDRLKRDNLFVLDPIDGTIGFSKGSPYWTIALALVRDHRPVAAVVYAPDAQEMYSAALGGGAWLNGEPVRA
ncbi:MAG: inositol monophosphatase family protein, partial [Asticcacaulis sp.]